MARSLLQRLQGSGAHKAILYSAGVVLVAAVILIVAGCYETDFEVIDAFSAVAVYGVTGTYNVESGGTMTISAVPHSNDYRFQEVSKDNKVSTGYIRMVPLKGDIYIVQAKYDNEDVYYLAFYRFTIDSSGSHYQPMYPDVDDSRLYQLAEQHDVMLDLDFIYLDGSRSNIMAFLRAHANLPFSSD
jgi:hypothetical protein